MVMLCCCGWLGRRALVGLGGEIAFAGFWRAGGVVVRPAGSRGELVLGGVERRVCRRARAWAGVRVCGIVVVGVGRVVFFDCMVGFGLWNDVRRIWDELWVGSKSGRDDVGALRQSYV